MDDSPIAVPHRFTGDTLVGWLAVGLGAVGVALMLPASLSFTRHTRMPANPLEAGLDLAGIMIALSILSFCGLLIWAGYRLAGGYETGRRALQHVFIALAVALTNTALVLGLSALDRFLRGDRGHAATHLAASIVPDVIIVALAALAWAGFLHITHKRGEQPRGLLFATWVFLVDGAVLFACLPVAVAWAGANLFGLGQGEPDSLVFAGVLVSVMVGALGLWLVRIGIGLLAAQTRAWQSAVKTCTYVFALGVLGLPFMGLVYFQAHFPGLFAWLPDSGHLLLPGDQPRGLGDLIIHLVFLGGVLLVGRILWQRSVTEAWRPDEEASTPLAPTVTRPV